MITIGAVLAEYGLTLADVAKYASQAVTMGEAYSLMKNYVSFTSLYRQTFPNTTRQTADLMWRLGKYWFQQGSALSQIDPNQVIPRQLARVTSQPDESIGLYSQYRYTVTTQFVDPRTGSTQYYSTIVSSSDPLSLSEAFADAYMTALEAIESYDPFSREELGYEEVEFSQSLYSFTRYEMGA